jgi:hemerythrin-like domain-containing protein
MERLLGLLNGEATLLGRGAEADLALMIDVLRYLTDYPDRYHHPVEDLALWRLAERGLIGRADAEALDFEHRSVRFHGARLLRRLEGAVADTPTPRAELAMAANQYAGALHAHLAHEEQVLLPLLERHLAGSDWREIFALAAPPPDPLFGEHTHARFAPLRAAIAARAHCGCAAEPPATVPATAHC